MTVGAAAATANSWLNVFRATTYTGVSVFLQLHTGDPGAAGTANQSTVTTRQSVTFAAASAGSMALSSMGGTYSMTATETISHVSLWTASSAGTFLASGALSASKSVVNGDTLSISTLTLSFTPIAA